MKDLTISEQIAMMQAAGLPEESINLFRESLAEKQRKERAKIEEQARERASKRIADCFNQGFTPEAKAAINSELGRIEGKAGFSVVYRPETGIRVTLLNELKDDTCKSEAKLKASEPNNRKAGPITGSPSLANAG